MSHVAKASLDAGKAQATTPLAEVWKYLDMAQGAGRSARQFTPRHQIEYLP
ncbi:MAG: hypothetical protein OXB94_05305 [Nitrospira sp.]|nr:hypothetical protein [Nitrospira sp.]